MSLQKRVLEKKVRLETAQNLKRDLAALKEKATLSIEADKKSKYANRQGLSFFIFCTFELRSLLSELAGLRGNQIKYSST